MPSDQLFLITGATGNTGAPPSDAARRRPPVRAFVHRSDRRSDALAAIGAEVVTGDLLDFHAVSSAMSGVSAAYFATRSPRAACCRPLPSSPRQPAKRACARWSTCRRYPRDVRRKAMLHSSTGSPSGC